MKNARAVAAFAPATVANVCVGFDILGLAVDAPGDIVVASRGTRRGLCFAATEPNDGFPRAIAKNTAGAAAHALMKHLGMLSEPVELQLKKGMARGSGMGSSAASAAAAVVAVNRLLGSPLRKSELLPFAVVGEQVADGAWHADNVAPSLLGGIVLIRDSNALDVVALPYPDSLHVVLVHPNLEVLTEDARAVLSNTVTRELWIEQSADLGAFISALHQNDMALLARSMRDHIIEPQRARLLPHLQAAREHALAAGALGCGISGSGPALFAFAKSHAHGRRIANAMTRACTTLGLTCQSWVSPINARGARVTKTEWE